MYRYIFDVETGGVLLTDSDDGFSKEPRPVWAEEMNILDFNKFWHYENQNKIPYLWAESGKYFYRGKIIAVVKGGNLYQKPTLEVVEENYQSENNLLLPVDIQKMIEKNRDRLESLRQQTTKRIFNYWRRYKNKLDCFHVAFSGGKDSIVLLDLVKNALPKSAFIVVFGDTGMEFPDTYKVIDEVEKQCNAEKIEFYRAAAKMSPEESWKLFGPPSRGLRWCCSVHKAAPQTLKIREVLKKTNFTGSAFVGVRANESVKRAEYEVENIGKKQRGQLSNNAILEWGSAEIWLYIFMQNLIINETYKKGNSRAGCLFCPLATDKNDFFKQNSYPTEIQKYCDLIFSALNPQQVDEFYIQSGAWIVRINGRDLKNPVTNYNEKISNDYLYITVENPKTDWKEWIKTVGEINFPYEVMEENQTVTAKVKAVYDKTPAMKIFKSVFRKSAVCVNCGVCEANCRQGAISFKKKFYIDKKKCIHCLECHNIEKGCILYHSTELLLEGEKKMKQSLNAFSTHAPKPEWIREFFDNPEEFMKQNSLGKNQFDFFRRFIYDCEFAERKTKLPTEFTELVKKIGWNTSTAWGLILVNLVYNNPQIRWYVENMPIGQEFTVNQLKGMLLTAEVSPLHASQIIPAFKRLCETPLGTELNFGLTTNAGKNLSTLKRTKTKVEDGKVILYALYKLAEKIDQRQFNLTKLINLTDSDGVSPTKIFGIDYEEMQQILNGLSANYSEFINATFTHDLEKISLSAEKNSEDVLNLF